MKRKIFNIILMSLIFAFILSLATMCYASIVDSLSQDIGGTGIVLTKGNKVLGYIQAIGVITAVVMLIVMGIKYTTCTIGEKAQVKERLIPFLIGTVLIFGAVGILQAVKSLNLFR